MEYVIKMDKEALDEIRREMEISGEDEVEVVFTLEDDEYDIGWYAGERWDNSEITPMWGE